MIAGASRRCWDDHVVPESARRPGLVCYDLQHRAVGYRKDRLSDIRVTCPAGRNFAVPIHSKVIGATVDVWVGHIEELSNVVAVAIIGRCDGPIAQGMAECSGCGRHRCGRRRNRSAAT